ncbi:MAG: type II toxin-antitoxin system prevent-host-death family antitoxin [Verrucomicrobiota bacterium]|nr:type II toxin-antitoxin system prevent-host-death family antitoxin [Verrucomicrobiota bacterium]
MKQIALSKIKDDLSRFLREAASEQIVITRHGRPAGILVGFASEDDWLDYRLEHDPGFLTHIASARASIEAGRGVKLEDLNTALKQSEASKNVLQRPGAVMPVASSPSPSRPTTQRSRASGQRLSLWSLSGRIHRI